VTDRWRIAANLATLANGLLGVGAILYTLAGNPVWAMLLIACAIGFDGLDGLLSRRSPAAASRLGPVLDSIADATSFGLAPAFLLAVHTADPSAWRPFAPELLALAAAYFAAAIARLAYFTARAHDRPHFLGVPTPQSALAIIVLLLFHELPAYASVQPIAVLIGASIVTIMMVVPVRYPKIRRGAPLRLPATIAAGFAALALVPLQFRPASSSPLGLAAEAGAYGLLAGVAIYYLLGPFTVPGPTSAAEAS
jgi:CDP-diacylglycerol--serine O-phosphatidyltransferase